MSIFDFAGSGRERTAISATALFVAFLVAALFVACEPASKVPESGEQDVSIAYLKALYSGVPTEITADMRITGTVVSSDRDGNFYHTLVLDDRSGGIEIKLGMDEIFKRFMIHTRVSVRCGGLWLGTYGGTLQLGTEPSTGAEPSETYETQQLNETEIAEHLFPDNGFYGEVLPRTVAIPELSERDVSTFVALESVRFVEAEQGLTWADVSQDAPPATDRHIVDTQGNTLIVRTSRYARFAARTLPRGTGRIEGVLGYFGADYQLVVTDAMKFSEL